MTHDPARTAATGSDPATTDSGQQSPPPLLEMRGITKRFPGVTALSNVSFDVHAGEVHCLVGENGAGKSTLMKIMSGEYIGEEGEIRIDGDPVRFNSPAQSQEAGIAMIHQELNLVAELPIFENIFLGRQPQNALGIIARSKMRRKTAELLEQLGLDVTPDTRIRQLRVGQQQLVEIAKAIRADARLIIMDEPTSALSDTEVGKLFTVIRDLRAAGVAIVYISHRLDEIFAIADRITVLRDGTALGTSLPSELSRARVIELMVGREMTDLYPKHPVTPGRKLLEVRGLSYQRGAKRIVNDVSLDVHAGEIVGVAGLMGAGRTELLESIFGAFPSKNIKGQMRFKDVDGVPASPQAAIAAGIGLIAEDRKHQSLILDQSVSNNASLASLPRFLKLNWIINHRQERRAVGQVVKDLNVRTPYLHTHISTLSGGNQQKVVFGRFTLTEVDLFLLDEPTRGVDVGAKSEIYELVGNLAAQGKAFLVVSSELPELLAICDRIYVLCGGRLTAEFPRSQFNQEAIMDAATSFDAAANGGA